MKKFLFGLTALFLTNSTTVATNNISTNSSATTMAASITCNNLPTTQDGSTLNPFVICNQTDFNAIATKGLNKKYVLGGDISLRNHQAIAGDFTGELFGQGFNITLTGNLNPHTTTGATSVDQYGLFATARNAEFKSIKINSAGLGINATAATTGNVNFGLLAASSTEKTYVDSVHINEDLTLNLDQDDSHASIGLLFGTINTTTQDLTIIRSSATGSVLVNSENNVDFGGFVGNVTSTNRKLSIFDSFTNLNALINYNGSNINHRVNVGGFVGHFIDKTSTNPQLVITHSYANGQYTLGLNGVIANAGGFIGQVDTTIATSGQITGIDFDGLLSLSNIYLQNENPISSVSSFIGNISYVGTTNPSTTRNYTIKTKNLYQLDSTKLFTTNEIETEKIVSANITEIAQNAISYDFLTDTLKFNSDLWFMMPSKALWVNDTFTLGLVGGPALALPAAPAPEANIAVKNNDDLIFGTTALALMVIAGLGYYFHSRNQKSFAEVTKITKKTTRKRTTTRKKK